MQFLHAVAPSTSWKVPGAHLLHEALPVDAAMLPGEHSVGMTEPIGHAEPGGQSEHCSAADSMEALAKVPGTHATLHEVAPAALNVLQSQRVHGLALGPALNWPAGQALQGEPENPGEHTETVPSTQSLSVLDPFCAVLFPDGHVTQLEQPVRFWYSPRPQSSQ